MNFRNLCLTIAATAVLYSCNSTDNAPANGAIVLGDSATIVTETDSQYLADFISDLQALPRQSAANPVTETTTPDTTRATEPKTQESAAASQPIEQPADKGLSVDFKDIQVFIPAIETKTYGSSIKNNRSAAYQLTGGKLNGNKLRISGGTIERVSQRYQTSVIMKHESGNLLLESLTYTSEWKTLKGRKEISITGLDDQTLAYEKATKAQIQAAVKKALREKGVSKKREQDYLDDIRNIRSVNQKPLDVVLRTVIWQINGKDSKGRSFQKELRIDMSV